MSHDIFNLDDLTTEVDDIDEDTGDGHPDTPEPEVPVTRNLRERKKKNGSYSEDGPASVAGVETEETRRSKREKRKVAKKNYAAGMGRRSKMQASLNGALSFFHC